MPVTLHRPDGISVFAESLLRVCPHTGIGKYRNIVYVKSECSNVIVVMTFIVVTTLPREEPSGFIPHITELSLGIPHESRNGTSQHLFAGKIRHFITAFCIEFIHPCTHQSERPETLQRPVHVVPCYRSWAPEGVGSIITQIINCKILHFAASNGKAIVENQGWCEGQLGCCICKVDHPSVTDI